MTAELKAGEATTIGPAHRNAATIDVGGNTGWDSWQTTRYASSVNGKAE